MFPQIRHMTHATSAALLVMLLAGMAGTATAGATEVIKLAIAADPGMPGSATAVLKKMTLPTIDAVLAADGGKYKIDWSFTGSDATRTVPAGDKKTGAGKPSGQMPAFASVSAGLADIGFADIRDMAGTLPMLQISFLHPFPGIAPKTLVPAIANTIDQSPEIRQVLLKRNHVLLAVSASSEFVLVTKFPVINLASLKSKKIGLPEAAVSWITPLAATPVVTPMPRYSTDLQSAALDGIVTDLDNALRLKLLETAPHVTRIGTGSMFTGIATMNRERWDGLPVPVRDAIFTGFWKFQSDLAEQETNRAQALLRSVSAGGGQVTDLNTQDRKHWATMLPDLSEQWLKTMKSRGQPGTKIIGAYLEQVSPKVQQSKQNPGK